MSKNDEHLDHIVQATEGGKVRRDGPYGRSYLFEKPPRCQKVQFLEKLNVGCTMKMFDADGKSIGKQFLPVKDSVNTKALNEYARRRAGGEPERIIVPGGD